MRRALVVVGVLILGWAVPAAAQRPEGRYGGSGTTGARPPAGDFLTQPPTGSTCAYSDPQFPQVIADDFVVAGAPIQIDEIVLWGFYDTGNTPGADNFHVRFMFDSGGLPGADVAAQETNVPTARTATGGMAFGLDEYEFTLTLASPIGLSAGTYWVEIYNDVTGSTDTFCWEGGQTDPTNGIAGSAFAQQAPGASWTRTVGDQSLELNGLVVPVELESFEIER